MKWSNADILHYITEFLFSRKWRKDNNRKIWIDTKTNLEYDDITMALKIELERK
mgnify:FL=1